MILKTAPTHQDERIGILECASVMNCSVLVCNTEQQRELVRELNQKNRIRVADTPVMDVMIYTFKQLMEGNARGKFAEDEIILVNDMNEIMDCFLHVYGIRVEIQEFPCEYQTVG